MFDPLEDRIGLLITAASSVPPGDHWLGRSELRIQRGLRVANKRLQWRHGRFTAKTATRAWQKSLSLPEIEILAMEDGSPVYFERHLSLQAQISISHRERYSCCAISNKTVGCDLELHAPISARLVDDFFARPEADAWRELKSETQRDALACLIWSAKESTLKVLKTGLRRNTKTLRAVIDDRVLRSIANICAPSPNLFRSELYPRRILGDFSDASFLRWQRLTILDQHLKQAYRVWWLIFAIGTTRYFLTVSASWQEREGARCLRDEPILL